MLWRPIISSHKTISDELDLKIEKNRAAFSNFNMVRMREALRYFTPKKLELFLKIPFFLHINSPGYPGYINTKSMPYGIWKFERSGFYKQAVLKQLFPKSVVETNRVTNPAILGFYHIGSLGTFTQSSGSDFDYWVIIDKKKFSRERYESLEKKLDAIVNYCRENHGQKVSFFIMDQKEIQTNQYLPFSGEETLTVPKIFLKEEFYRTFLMIAGKIPLWAVLPSDLSLDSSMKTMADIRHILSVHEDLIDLGQISTIPLADVLKGLLWHICKSKSDPVKALIKATMIFSYGFDQKKTDLLLCEKIKQGYAMAGIDDYGVDPYKIVFDQILDFHERHDPKGINLIKNAIFYRLCGYPHVQMPDINSPKRILLDKYIRLWNLNKNQVNKLLSYSDWSESEKLLLERSFIQRLAQMVNQAKERIGQTDHLIKDSEKRNWIILNNKTKERLTLGADKVTECSTFLKRRQISQLNISETSNGFKLDLITKDGQYIDQIYQHQDLLAVLGWILENQLYHRQSASLVFKTSMQLFESADTHINLDNLYLKLLPVKPLSDDCFEQTAKWSKMLVLLYYDVKELIQAELLISNTWGELYMDRVDFRKIPGREDQCLHLARQMVKYREKDLRTFICQYSNMHDPTIVYEVKKAYNKFDSETSRPLKGKKKPYLDRL
ncbi:MAG: class I adenylate cyclase [Pseudomonadota bacterium]